MTLITLQNYVVGGRVWQIAATRDQDAMLSQVRTDTDLEHFPYGLLLWPSALGLCEALCRDPGLVVGKRVIEIGAGTGLAGIVAQSLGGVVTQTDYLPATLDLCRENARLNGISGVDVRIGDWRDWPSELTGFPVVLGADVLYERSLHSHLRELLPRVVAPGGVFLLSDPMRPQSVDFMADLESTGVWDVEMQTRTVVWEDKPKEIALFYGSRKDSGVSPTV